MIDKETEAKRLAATIRAFWKARGHSPLIWVDRQYAPASGTDCRFVYVVRSDMVGGWPCRYSLPATSSRALPPAVVKSSPGVEPDSPSPFAALAGIRQPLGAFESVRRSNRVWRDVGAAHG